MRLSPETLRLQDFWWLLAIAAAFVIAFQILNALRRRPRPPPEDDR